MKKLLKVLGIILGVVVLLIAAGALFIQVRGIPSYEVRAVEISIPADSAHIERGEKLVSMICSDCHRGESGKLEGKKLFDIPKIFGEAYSANITNHPEYGLGRYSDGELAYLLRTGIKKNGAYTPPYMPKFPHLSDDDLKSVIAYLRSDAVPVQAVDKPSIPCRPSFLTKFLCYVAFKPLPYPEKAIIAPDPSDKVAYGEYLALGALDCYSCHSEDFKTVNIMEPEKSPGFFGGGNQLLDLDGNVILSANITTHPEFGIGKWTEEQFVQAVRFGTRPDGSPLSVAMPKFSAMSDDDARAIWAYLQTVPVQSNEVLRVSY